MASPFRLHNSLTREVEDFTPIEEGKIGLYVCGMTVYDHCHVGHARSMVTYDVIVRYLRSRGWDVTFVRNFTDVDDKIIERANERGIGAIELAEGFIDEFHKEMALLGLAPPSHEPRVSSSIEEIQAMIQVLLDRGHAYLSEGSVWFQVDTYPEYGKLSGQRVEMMKSADPGAGKRAAADFALWKASKPSEPSWDSDWGPGRPAWHIECSAMAKHWLGDTIDIHGGGLDLKFPHHENEVAQSQCSNGVPYARYWLHNGLLNLASGAKMSKSLGTVVNIQDALKEFPGETIRLYYIQNHYRSPLPWGDQALPEALGMLARLYEAREVAEGLAGDEDADRVAKDLGEDAAKVLELGRGFAEGFYAAMDEDFNTALALGRAFELARAVNRFANHKKARKRGGPIVAPALAAFALVAEGLGLLCCSSAEFQAEVKTKRLGALGLKQAQVEALIEERVAARDAKNWARADEIRDELDAQGIVLRDLAAGMEWRVRLIDAES